jgi:PAS domain S-box-containing protein
VRRFDSDGPDLEARASAKELKDFKHALDEHSIVAVTDPRGRITYVNEKFCAISGYSREELLGQDHRLINSGHHPQEFFRGMWETIRAGRAWHGEIRNRAKNGAHYWVDTTIVPFLDGEGRLLKFVAIRTDITSRKEAEEALRISQKLESLGVLAGGIAHDFNNLLTTILGNAELAALGIPSESPAQPFLAQIDEAVLKAANLTRQLLAYAGKGRFVLADIDLNLLVREMTQLLSVTITKKVVIRYDLAPSLPLVSADPSQIQQVVMNLVTNASEAIGDERSGLVTIRTSTQILDDVYVRSIGSALPLAPGHFVILEVTDTGCGMTPAIVDRIFDPFFTTKFSGRGLGLSAMLGILRSHHGSIKIYSEPGKGSTFKVFLPVVEDAARTPEIAVEQAPWKGQGLLLLVDDESQARAVARAHAESLGFRIIEAADGREGLQIFEEQHREIALVLLDLTMPHMDGREAFQRMRALDSAVPIVLTSGFNEQEVTEQFLGRGLAGFLPKPFQRAQFRAVLQAAMKAGDR